MSFVKFIFVVRLSVFKFITFSFIRHPGASTDLSIVKVSQTQPSTASGCYLTTTIHHRPMTITIVTTIASTITTTTVFHPLLVNVLVASRTTTHLTG